MAKAGPHAQALQKRMIQVGVDGPLGEVGFSRIRKRLTWVREIEQLIHIVNAWTRWGKYYMIQWGIRCEPVTTIVWGVQRDPFDVAYSAITSRAEGDGSTWEVDDDTTDEAVEEMAEATASTLRALATWLTEFHTRQDCLAWLLADDEHPEVVVPSSGSRLFTAAAFAAADGDPIACDLAERVEESGFTRFGKVSQERLRRLKQWIEPRCSEAAPTAAKP